MKPLISPIELRRNYLNFSTALKFLQRKVRMVRFFTETHELSREGKPWHRVIRLDHILHWFREHLKKAAGTSGE